MKKTDIYPCQPENTQVNLLAYPLCSGNPTSASVSDTVSDLDTLLDPYLNLTDGDKLLYYTWVIHQRLSARTPIPRVVYDNLPILILTGPKGCGKSLLAKITKPSSMVSK